MALYKSATYLTQSTDQAFDSSYSPGASAPRSGIFRCTGCGKEIVSTQHHTLPPQNHHTHAVSQGSILWKLIVAADHNP